MKPTILIAATSHWFPAARLAMALADAGCDIQAVCPARHPLCEISSVRRTYRYSALSPLRSLEGAIKASRPQLVIPSDDLAARHLHLVHARNRGRGDSGAWLSSLIEQSLGAPESFPVMYQRATLMSLAHQVGVRVPQSSVLENIDELTGWASQVGFPFVLKADGTSGGDGVRIVRTVEEAEKAYRKLKAPVQLARAAKRALVDYDKTLLWPSLMRRRGVVSAQTFVAGHEATSTVACWNGSILAALHFEVINKRHNAGPATVMRVLDHPEMSVAVEKVVRRLKLSGVHGFDFMLEAGSGNAYLIEMNPRTTQVGHLTLGAGRDIPAALVAALSDSTVHPAPKLTENELITLFPQEWMRDPASPYLRGGYHDVPWAEPGLLQVCIRHARKHHAVSARRNREQQSPACLLPINSSVASENSMVRSGDSRYE
jgi:hypothetical protein